MSWRSRQVMSDSTALRPWCAISDVSGHWTELFVVPVGRSVRPKGLHKPGEAPPEEGPGPAPEAQ